MSDDTTPGRPDPFDYDPDDSGPVRNFDVTELSPADEARRAELLSAALAYAEMGFEVFPLSHVEADGKCSASKQHCKCKDPEHAGKCQVLDHWDKEASSDPDKISVWWGPRSPGDDLSWWYPLGNIGLSMRNTNCIAMDIDPRHGGTESLGLLLARGMKATPTRAHQTARDGLHYIYRAPDYVQPRNYYAKPRGIAPGIDLIGLGFLFAPPSIVGAGAYTVLGDGTAEIADLPEYVLNWINARSRECQGLPAHDARPPAPDGRRRRYGAAALAGEKKKLAECQDGRNNQLNISALALGSLSEECSISYEEAYDALGQACEANGLLRDDGVSQFTASFKSGWGTGLRKPRHPEYSDSDSEELATITPRRWNQYGNGERLVDAYGDVLAWNNDREHWMLERNGVWRNGDGKTGFRFARRMIDSLATTEALCYPDDDGDQESDDKRSTYEKFLDRILDWSCRSETSAAAEFGLTHDIMCCANADFDTDPDLLNCPNLVLNLRSGELIGHAETDQRFTMQTAASYSKDAQCPRFIKFLEQAQPEAEIRKWLQIRTGYAVFGDASEQVAFFDYGSGGCGKSVFSDTIAAVLGSYAQGVYVETLTRARKDGTVSTDIASMAGKRYLVASETRPGQSLDEQAFKQLTGDRTVRAHKMRQDFDDFLRTWTIQLIANDPVHVSDDSATWRRILVTKWENPVAEATKDKHLITKILDEESSGVLAWIVEGARMWASQGLAVPPTVRDWTAEYKAEEDYLEVFIEEWCLKTEPAGQKDATVGQRLPSVIHEMYRYWAKKTGAPELGRKVLIDRLVSKGFEREAGGPKHFRTLMVKYAGE